MVGSKSGANFNTDALQTALPLEAHSKFIVRLNLVLLGICVLSFISTVNSFISTGQSSNLITTALIVVTGIICGVCWYISKKGQTTLAAKIVIITIGLILSLIFMTNSPGIITLMAYMVLAIITLIILGAESAFAIVGLGNLLALFLLITGRLVLTTVSDGIKVSIGTLISLIVIQLLVIWLATYLKSSLKQANIIVQQQAAQLALALNNIEKKRAVGEDVSRQVFSLTAELNATANQQASGSQQQASALSQVISFVHEMTQTSQAIATKTNQLSEAAQEIKDSTQTVKDTAIEMTEAGEAGALAVERTVNSTQQVSNLYNDLKGVLDNLERRQEQIKNVVSIMRNISSETHLLALNAAIEAAGAGEFGERFAVVATEVKALANRSITASKEVNDILSDVETGIKEAATMSEKGQAETANALKLAEESGLAMVELIVSIQSTAEEVEKIEQAITVMSGQTREISVSTNQQHDASAHALETLQEIGLFARQTATSSSEVTRTARDLEGLSQNLLTTLAA